MRRCIYCLLLPSIVGNGEEEKSAAVIQILFAGPFTIDISWTGSPVVLFELIADTRVSITSFS